MQLPNRIHILGASGSGTTSLAVTLASRYGRRHLDTDALQLIRDILPKADAIGVLANLANPTTPPVVRATETASGQLRVQVNVVDAREAKDLAGAFEKFVRSRADALVVISDPRGTPSLARGLRAARLHGWRGTAVVRSPPPRSIPARRGLRRPHTSRRETVRASNRATDEVRIDRQSKAARALRLTIPQPVLLQADEVIQ